VLAAVLYVLIDLPWLAGNARNVQRMFERIQGRPLQVRVCVCVCVCVYVCVCVCVCLHVCCS
jgi:hypothetical protein